MTELLVNDPKSPPTGAASRICVLGAALLFSTGGAAIKLSALSSWQIAGFRSGLAALFLWLLVPAWRHWWHPASLAVGTAFAATLVLFVTANKLTTAANAIFLQYTAPLYVLVLAPLLLGEHRKPRDAVHLALVAVGLVLFFVGQQAPSRTAPEPMLGNMVAAGSGVTWALTLMGLRWLSKHEHATGAGGAAVIAGNAICFVVCLPFAIPVQGAVAIDWTVVGYLGIVQIGLAYVLLLRGVRGLRTFEVSLLLVIEPLVSAIWAWLIHSEIPSITAAAGCAFIFVSLLIQALPTARE